MGFYRHLLVLSIVLLLLPLLGLGCGERFFTEDKGQSSPDQGSRVQTLFKKARRLIGNRENTFIRELSPEQKQSIDDWLRKNQLNEYGDPFGAVYAGGTPLFDEQTGGTANRYEYLFKKFPELKDIIKNAKGA